MRKSKLQTKFDNPQVSPGFLLWQISNKWQAEQRKALAIFGLTHVQFVLLASLTWATGKTSFTQKQLAMHARTDIMMTSQVVRTLEQKDLLTRAISPNDGRSFVLTPTQAGIALVNKAIVVVEAVDKRFFAVLGEDVPSLILMMQQLAN